MSKKDFLAHVNEHQEEKQTESFKEEVLIPLKGSTNKVWMISTMILLMLCIILIVNPFASGVSVIDLVGMHIDDVSYWSNSTGIIVSPVYVYDETVDENHVISQNVDENASLEQGAVIKVVVSKGLDPNQGIALPDFDARWSKSSIVNWLDENGVKNYQIITMQSDAVDEDYLIDYKVIGTEKENFKRSSSIEFIVNEVSESATITVGNFIQSDILALDVWAKENNLTYNVVYEPSDIYEPGKIIAQSIAEGSSLSVDEVFSVTISRGREDHVVVMTNLIGDSVASAITWLKGENIEYVLEYSSSAFYQENTVMNQSILNQQLVFPNDVLILTVSDGSSDIADDYRYIAYDEALIKAGNNASIIIKEVYADNTVKGEFITQSVAAGNFYSNDHPLTVTYSLGSKIPVEDFRDTSIIHVNEWLDTINQENGQVTLNVSYEANSQYESGMVISQSVYNDYLSMGDALNVVISKGTTMPEFYGMTKDEIERLDAESMMTIKIVEAYHATKEDGEIISQSVQPGQAVNDNTVVTVVISLGNTVICPDYMGESVGGLKEWVMEENAKGANITLSVYESYHDSVGYGKIISQDPFNVSLDVGSEINVIASKGASILAPDLRYYSPEYLESFADDNNILIVIDYLVDEGLAENTFISQSIEAGSKMSKEQIIKVIYSKKE